MNNESQALVLDKKDNVVILLSDAHAGDEIPLKGGKGSVVLTDDVAYGHKAALKRIGKGEEIIKYGHRIGIAASEISPGSWVHLHNMTSAVDSTFKRRIDSCTPNR